MCLWNWSFVAYTNQRHCKKSRIDYTHETWLKVYNKTFRQNVVKTSEGSKMCPFLRSRFFLWNHCFSCVYNERNIKIWCTHNTDLTMSDYLDLMFLLKISDNRKIFNRPIRYNWWIEIQTRQINGQGILILLEFTDKIIFVTLTYIHADYPY